MSIMTKYELRSRLLAERQYIRQYIHNDIRNGIRNDIRKDICNDNHKDDCDQFRADVMSEAVTANTLSSLYYKTAHRILCYISTPLEVDTHAIISAALSDGKQVYCPRVVGKTMEFRRVYGIDNISDLATGAYNIPEPPATAELYTNSDNDTNIPDTLCIVPCLAATLYGDRLGYGGGYYDRFLSGFKGYSAALCFEKNIIDRAAFPYDPWDVNVDFLITEKTIHDTE
jgi:5-formyltetrahydrofolate cyclo-ligase